MYNAPKFKDTFLQEAGEHLDRIEAAVLCLEEAPDDAESLNGLFRAVHTIKGSAAMVGLDAVSDFAHGVENVLDRARGGELAVTKELVDLILLSRDHLHTLMDAGEAPEGPALEPGDRILGALHGLLPAPVSGKQENGKPVLKIVQPRGSGRRRSWRIRFKPGRESFTRGLNPMPLFDELRDLGDCAVHARTDAVPDLTRLNPEHCHLFWDIFLTGDADLNAVKDVFIFVEDDGDIRIDPVDDPAWDGGEGTGPRLGDILVDREDVAPAGIRKALENQKRIGEMLVAAGEASPDSIRSALTEQSLIRRRQSDIGNAAVRVRSEKLDELINLVGEVVVNQARLNRLAATSGDKAVADPIKESDRLTARLRDCALEMRMLPIGSIFGKFKRLVRDLAADCGKEIDLITDGADTEMDKSMIDRLGDPLVHLIRNAVDHGVESPEAREAAGKPRRGTIHLSALHKGAHVVVTVADDGRGIDLDAVRDKAVRNGLIAGDADLSDAALLDLISMPGFSTSRTVSSVSGRGVGMDSVKRDIEALGGSVRLDNRVGGGVETILSLPLTLAIIDGLMVRVDAALYVLPVSAVIKCAELDPARTTASAARNSFVMHDEPIPFVRLREFFGDAATDPDGPEHIVIVQQDDERAGIVVDEIVGTRQTLIKSLGNAVKGAPGVSGGTIMGDGGVALILDIPAILCSAGTAGAQTCAEEGK